MASVGTVGGRVQAVVGFVAGALDTLFITVSTLLASRKLLCASRLVARVPIGAAPSSSCHDSCAGATTLARKGPRRAQGSQGRIDAAVCGGGSYRYRLVRVWNSAESLGWGAAADPDRARQVAGMLGRAGMKRGGSLAVLGWTDGQPCLPLDVPADTTPQCFTLEGVDDMGWVVSEIDDPRWGQLIGGAA
jgi:hypothetical protein